MNKSNSPAATMKPIRPVSPHKPTKPVQATGNGRLPGMRVEVRRVYDGLRATGATTPANAKPMSDLAKQLRLSKHELQDALRDLEGKGVVGRIGGPTAKWFAIK